MGNLIQVLSNKSQQGELLEPARLLELPVELKPVLLPLLTLHGCQGVVNKTQGFSGPGSEKKYQERKYPNVDMAQITNKGIGQTLVV